MKKDLLAVLAFGFVLCLAGTSLAGQKEPSPTIEIMTNTPVKICPLAAKKIVDADTAAIKKLETALLDCIKQMPTSQVGKEIYSYGYTQEESDYNIIVSKNTFIVQRTSFSVLTANDFGVFFGDTPTGPRTGLSIVFVDRNYDGQLDDRSIVTQGEVSDETVNLVFKSDTFPGNLTNLLTHCQQITNN